MPARENVPVHTEHNHNKKTAKREERREGGLSRDRGRGRGYLKKKKKRRRGERKGGGGEICAVLERDRNVPKEKKAG